MTNYKKCLVEKCENNASWENSGANGYCRKHYSQLLVYGKILERTIHDPNEIMDCSGYYEICLYNRKHEEVGRALIDKKDLKKVKNHKWCLDGKGYVVSSREHKKQLRLHRLILGKIPKGYEIDHRFGNKLDNRKKNLRFVTHSQNEMNKKKKGYSYHKKSKKWETYIGINNELIHLGYFINEQDAIKARQEAELKYFGEFAYKRNNNL